MADERAEIDDTLTSGGIRPRGLVLGTKDLKAGKRRSAAGGLDDHVEHAVEGPKNVPLRLEIEDHQFVHADDANVLREADGTAAAVEAVVGGETPLGGLGKPACDTQRLKRLWDVGSDPAREIARFKPAVDDGGGAGRAGDGDRTNDHGGG